MKILAISKVKAAQWGNISWEDAQKFIGIMNDMKPELKLQLPTEAQWEYACRAGSTTPFCWGEHINSELVNFNGNNPHNKGTKSEYRIETVDVESFYQNDWGLWQMHGNVFEWCQDWYDAYPENIEIDPVGSQTGGDRVLRGGSFLSSGRDCRSAYRSKFYPSSHLDYYGFRLLRGY